MSYASVASHNAPPLSQQPHPDPALLTTQPPTADNIADDASKLNIVGPDFKSNPATLTSEQDIPVQPPSQSRSYRFSPSSSHVQPQDDRKLPKGKEAHSDWEVAKHALFQPLTAGGLLGLVNVGLLSGAGYLLFTTPELRHSTRAVSVAAAATGLLFGIEGFFMDFFAAPRDVRREVSSVKRHGVLTEHLLRPGVLGGFVGLANTAVIGTVGYITYTHSQGSLWNRRSITTVSLALLTLWTGEGYLAEVYRRRKHD